MFRERCDDCGTYLNPGFKVCPSCGHRNVEEEKTGGFDYLRKEDAKKAKALGFTTLRAYYEDLHQKVQSGKKPGGFLGLGNSKPAPFNPDEILQKVGQYYVDGRPSNNNWMDVPL